MNRNHALDDMIIRQATRLGTLHEEHPGWHASQRLPNTCTLALTGPLAVAAVWAGVGAVAYAVG
ncbi:hypothetical protein ACF9IK_09245 [Kitasatospora hibisci]|uniref:hypothetical protein n=1 Tax=Kitasatospora hibisci TaxID=3369522 RepID=UPI003754173B